MAARNKPYEQFGTYILFKKLESDALGELWRAARIEGSQLGSLVALRRLTGGNRQALHDAAMTAREVAPLLTGTSFAKNQVIDAIDGVPYIAHDYAGGRSLRHIIDRARGGNGVTPNPLPIDQAMVIAEKVALSLATTADLRHGGNRLIHGALIPQFVWITDDGEIRVAGQGLGSGLLASLKEAKVGAELGRYVAPELHHGGEPSKATEVYAMGALLYVLVTGVEPPDATTASAFAQVIRAAKATNGNPLPEDIRAILEKSLVVDPSARYASIQDMKQAISALAHGGKYSATTFNLAFYASNLLKKELEGEAIDREKENKVNVAPYLEAPAPVAAAAVAMPSWEAAAAQSAEPSRSKMPMILGAAAAVAGLAFGGYYFLVMKKDTKPANAPAANIASAAPIPTPRPQVVSQPLVASTPQTDTAAPTDTAAQQKAFEQAVQQKLQEELMKLQADYTKQLQKQQSKNAPVPTPAPVVVENTPQQPETNAPSAAQLDQQRLTQRQESAPAVPTPQPSAPQQQVVQTAPQQQPAQPQPAPQVATVREGDVVDVNNVDTPPRVTRAVQPTYPPMAMRQRMESTILVSALVSENGDVLEVKVLRGDKRFGFEDAAIRAVRGTKFSPAVKDGKRVKTWFPLPVIFKL